MIVTDTIPAIFEPIFQEYNQPHKPARVFTFLTGQGDTAPAKWMACENKGYFSQVTNMEEVKDKVLRYVSVLARPMVLVKNHHPVKWTGVYADLEVPHNPSIWSIRLRKPTTRRKIWDMQGKKEGFRGYNMITSVSIPVYSKVNFTTMEKLGLKPK